MKSKINEQISQFSTVLPLSSQERGRGEFVKSRSEFVKMSGITNASPDKNKPSQPPLKREEHQGIRVSRKLKSKTNEKQNKRPKPSIFHCLTPLFPREG